MHINDYFFSYNLLIAIVLMVIIVSCGADGDKLFTPVPPNTSNVHFSNRIIESDSLNILDYEYIYNGGGVGIGDFNNRIDRMNATDMMTKIKTTNHTDPLK